MNSTCVHSTSQTSQLSRRSFVIAMAGAGVVLGFARSGVGSLESITSSAKPASSVGELFEPTIWYGISPSGDVSVNIIRAEMGQHIGTALARILADELEVDWSKVRVVTSMDSAVRATAA